MAVKVTKGAQKLGGDVKEKFTAKPKKEEKVQDKAHDKVSDVGDSSKEGGSEEKKENS